MQQKLNIFEKFIYFINIIIAAMLLISYGVPYLFPQKFPELSALSLLLPVLLSINIIFIIFWAIRRKKQIVLSLFVLGVGFGYFTKFIQLFDRNNVPEKALTLMSFNVRLFNHYNWHPDKDLDQKIMTFIKEKNPDIIAIQEHYRSAKNEPKEYPYRKIIYKNKTDQSGQAVYSRFPILQAGSLNFPDTGNNGMYADIIIAHDTLRLYNVHLESMHINPEEEELSHENSKKLIRKIGSRFARQQEQTEILKAHMQTSPYRIIVCGDFNNTAFSYIYKEIKGKNMVDTFEKSGFGLGRTFNFKYFPLRIDFILMDSSIHVYDHQTFDVDYSDHFPIMAAFGLNNP
ncbi:MAG: endonuclease/exonuclease/phosphatase family protein [Capnocytophaga sp.]|nr:endonuclease/exonuclease/phosphatase family protein [Capnocytophaga sp.]